MTEIKELVSIVIVAAGIGGRFGEPKWKVKLAGKTFLEWCLRSIERLSFEKELIVIGGESPIQGGATRSESVRYGLKAAKGDIVLIHNVANPMASVEDFARVHQWLLNNDGAAFVGQPINDTLRRVSEARTETIDRKHMWRVQTPQGFRRETLVKLLDENRDDDLGDEVILYERAGLPVKAFETSPWNIKVTYPSDLEFLERYWQTGVLVGIGEDSHFFDKSGMMMIGGVKVEGVPKLYGNSDGDIILHALFNAISSALGGGSIGPTADPMAEQGIIDSVEYLKVILMLVSERGYRINNVSISIECAMPKIEPLIPELRKSLGKLVNIRHQKIGITATSGEGLTAFGRGEGVRCTCIVTLSK